MSSVPLLALEQLLLSGRLSTPMEWFNLFSSKYVEILPAIERKVINQ